MNFSYAIVLLCTVAHAVEIPWVTQDPSNPKYKEMLDKAIENENNTGNNKPSLSYSPVRSISFVETFSENTKFYTGGDLYHMRYNVDGGIMCEITFAVTITGAKEPTTTWKSITVQKFFCQQ
ncbi:hypothetical protein GE061_004655 [Apolygus lucorum]|uniref:Uncharacterized protein n=1 Tax=Apolygus lucorum TaxID=248454 RepID=A0A6A4IPK0_APOLU|nr:hypothetical protein GE061_004655 [Apolygus lucorum]